jgi:hypothetical protein
MMDHPSNYNHPTFWHARTYGLLTANPFGEKSFTKNGNGNYTLKKGASLTQKYGLLMQTGTFKKDAVEKAYQAFAK